MLGLNDVLVPIEDICDVENPLKNEIWEEQGDDPITREEISAALASMNFKTTPYADAGSKIFMRGKGIWTRETHIARIAFLTLFPENWGKVLISRFGRVLDGYHRLAAASYLNRHYIRAHIDFERLDELWWHVSPKCLVYTDEGLLNRMECEERLDDDGNWID